MSLTETPAAGLSTSWVEDSAVQVFRCDEHGPVDIPLDEILDASGKLKLNPEIEQAGYFSISLKAGQLALRARGYVGYIPLNEHIVVYVTPRTAISNLERIIEFAECAPTALTAIRPYATERDWNESLVDLYTAALVNGVEGIVSTGLLHDYVRREEPSSFPHGRILVQRTAQQLWPKNIRHKAHVAYYERAVDNPCNRCLKYAMAVVAQGYLARPPATRKSKVLLRRINSLVPAFELVSLDYRLRFLADPLVRGLRQLPAVRSYYKDVLSVAVAIIERKGVLLESPGHNIYLPSLVLDMDNVFERYMRRALTLQALESGWPVEVLDGNSYPGAKRLFRERPSPEANPDIVVRDASGAAILVCEVKNVPIKRDARFSERDAINQIVTYALSYGVGNGVLIHPCGTRQQSAGLRKLGDIQNVGIYQYRFNLGAEQLEEERRRFGHAMSVLMTLDTGG